jgi:hypothetical protein
MKESAIADTLQRGPPDRVAKILRSVHILTGSQNHDGLGVRSVTGRNIEGIDGTNRLSEKVTHKRCAENVKENQGNGYGDESGPPAPTQ